MFHKTEIYKETFEEAKTEGLPWIWGYPGWHSMTLSLNTEQENTMYEISTSYNKRVILNKKW